MVSVTKPQEGEIGKRIASLDHAKEQSLLSREAEALDEDSEEASPLSALVASEPRPKQTHLVMPPLGIHARRHTAAYIQVYD